MIEQVQPLKVLDEAEHATYFHSRERVRSLRDVTKGLFRNLSLPLDSGTFLTTQFGDRSRPIVVTQEIEVTGGSPSGVIWEIGSVTQGAGLSFNGGTLTAGAGDGVGNGGVTATLAGITNGERVQVAVAINPGTQRIGIYVNGHLESFADGVSAFTNGEYADSSDGQVNGVNGTATPRLVSTATLSDVSIVSPVSVYIGQLPRGFQA